MEIIIRESPIERGVILIVHNSAFVVVAGVFIKVKIVVQIEEVDNWTCVAKDCINWRRSPFIIKDFILRQMERECFNVWIPNISRSSLAGKSMISTKDLTSHRLSNNQNAIVLVDCSFYGSVVACLTIRRVEISEIDQRPIEECSHLGHVLSARQQSAVVDEWLILACRRGRRSRRSKGQALGRAWSEIADDAFYHSDHLVGLELVVVVHVIAEAEVLDVVSDHGLRVARVPAHGVLEGQVHEGAAEGQGGAHEQADNEADLFYISHF